MSTPIPFVRSAGGDGTAGKGPSTRVKAPAAPPEWTSVTDVETVSLFLALLAVLAQVTVGATLVLGVAAAVAGPARPLLRAARDGLTGLGVPFALTVAVVATSGSLYFSEVAHFIPCRLCWWQRFAMYPLVPILLLALLRPRWRLWRLALPLALVGAGIATYHSVIERWPRLDVASCAIDAPCTLKWVEELGYVTIPVMSLSAFLLVLTLLSLDPTVSPFRRNPS